MHGPITRPSTPAHARSGPAARAAARKVGRVHAAAAAGHRRRGRRPFRDPPRPLRVISESYPSHIRVIYE